MQSFSLTDITDRPDEVFDRATVEPILVTGDSRPGYVLLSLDNYRQLIDRLEGLEDRAFGELAKVAIARSATVGAEKFTAELTRLAGLENGDSL